MEVVLYILLAFYIVQLGVLYLVQGQTLADGEPEMSAKTFFVGHIPLIWIYWIIKGTIENG